MDFTFMERFARLLEGGLLAGAIIIVLLVILLTLLNYVRKSVTRRRAIREHFKETHQADGTPWPPHTRGICDECLQAFDRCYQMPDLRRLCPSCFHDAEGYKHAMLKPGPADPHK